MRLPVIDLVVRFAAEPFHKHTSSRDQLHGRGEIHMGALHAAQGYGKSQVGYAALPYPITGPGEAVSAGLILHPPAVSSLWCLLFSPQGLHEAG